MNDALADAIFGTRPAIKLYPTRFAGLGIRHYRDAIRCGVPGHRRPFRDGFPLPRVKRR